MPSATRPCAVWNSLTAACVAGNARIRDDIAGALVGMRSQVIGESVAIKSMLRIVRHVHCTDNAGSVRIVIRSRRLVSRVADSSVVGFAAVWISRVDLIAQ